jgi:hypothetical protein
MWVIERPTGGLPITRAEDTNTIAMERAATDGAET